MFSKGINSKGILFKVDLGNSDQSKDNVEHILQETSRILLTENLKVREKHIQTTLGNINEQIKQLTKVHDLSRKHMGK